MQQAKNYGYLWFMFWETLKNKGSFKCFNMLKIPLHYGSPIAAAPEPYQGLQLPELKG